jgi:hypothetical protein
LKILGLSSDSGAHNAEVELASATGVIQSNHCGCGYRRNRRAAHAAAIYYSLVQSCEANKVNLLSYLTYVLGNARNRSITLPTPD